MQWWKVTLLGVGLAALFGLGIIVGHFAIPKKDEPTSSPLQDLDQELLGTVMSQLDANRIQENLRWFKFDPAPFPTVNPGGTILFSARRSEENLTGEQGDPEVVQPYAAYKPRISGPCSSCPLMSSPIWTPKESQQLSPPTNPSRVQGELRTTWAQPEPDRVPTRLQQFLRLLCTSSRHHVLAGLALPQFPVTRGAPGLTSSLCLLSNLRGPVAPAAWQGALGCQYRLGPGFLDSGRFPPDSQVNVTVHNRVELRNSSNVLGVIRGAVEPDRYVLYGNHRDSWVHGAVDPSSGTAVLLEISRVLGTLVKKGKWRPRRSVVFASWGAEEFGLIGSTEFTEEFFTKLQERAVAYINVDIAVFIHVGATGRGLPGDPAQSVIFSAAKQVPAPENSALTVYDRWLRHSNRSSPAHGVIPSLGSLGSGSDYAAFLHFLGITSMDIAYTYDRSKTSARIYPTYHTAFDTFQYVERFLDPGFISHQAVARTAANALLRLSDSLLLPLNVSDYSETLRSFLQAAQDTLGPLLTQPGISLGPLVSAVGRFEQAAAALHQRIETLKNNPSDPLKVRMVNDQLMLLERAFLNPRAFPEKYYYSHVLWAPRTSSVPTFPGLANACEEASKTPHDPEAWAKVRKQLSIAVMAVEGAAATLEPVA
ncbi:aminopeptidase NAALADL1 [Sarcophilus harrisii]|uniref:aminopeptidase NAALADL1 n=1 Tax=Sarcophilus harrisii TaxID=9305 RepID=UPI001301D30A|nr:aminopeptidase NAALADL1 [Sarcophilus harrisii]